MKTFMTPTTHSSSRHFSLSLHTGVSLETAVDSSLTKACLQAGCVQRRAAFSAALGLGNCDGKQLLRQLNTYGFEKQHVTKALAAVAAVVP